MKKVSLAVTVICLICVLVGCGKSVPEEEPPQSFSNMESVDVPKETEPEEQSDEIQSDTEENSGLPTEQEEQEQIQSDQQVQNEPVEENGLESEEMRILMKINDEAVTE